MSPKTRRAPPSAVHKAEDAIEAWRVNTRDCYESAGIREAFEATRAPTVLCYDSTNSVGGDYGPVIELVETLARVLLTWPMVRWRVLAPLDVLFRYNVERFRVLHPGKGYMTDGMFVDFVKARFPGVVICHSGSGGAEKNENEMYISKALVQVYLDIQAGRRPCVVTDIQYAKVKRIVEFVLIATILHEFAVCLAKDLFGPGFLPKRGSDIGQDVETHVLGCITVLEWADQASFNNSEQLWHVDKLVGWVKSKDTYPKWYTLTEVEIDHVINMVHHGFISDIPFYDQLEDIGGFPENAIRAIPARDGMVVIVQQEDERATDATGSDSESESLSGFGPITLNPNAMRVTVCSLNRCHQGKV